MSRRRALGPAVIALLALSVSLGACSRHDRIDDAAATTTIADTAASDTTVALPSEVPDESTVPPDSSSTTEPGSEVDPGDDTGAFGHTDAELASFRAAYSASFDAECRRIWSGYAGADGLMADPDFAEDTYTVDDCLSELDPDYGEFADSVAEAQSSGVDDAQIAASDLADPLCATDGVTCWSYGDN